MCFAGSTILCQFSTLDPAFNPASVLRQFFDSASVPLRNCTSFSGLPPILRFFAGFVNPAAGFANSSILSLVPLADPASFAAILFSRYRIFISQ